MTKKYLENSNSLTSYRDGRVLPPLLLWFFGVPAGLCLILWLLFFRG